MPTAELRESANRLIEHFSDESDLVLEFQLRNFSGDLEIASTTTYGTGLFKGTRRAQRDDAEDEHVVFDVAAGATDVAGVLTGSPLVLSEGDLLVWQAAGAPAAIPVPIVKTGALAATDQSDPVAYVGLRAMTRANV